jgi:hypothetical protein
MSEMEDENAARGTVGGILIGTLFWCLAIGAWLLL